MMKNSWKTIGSLCLPTLSAVAVWTSEVSGQLSDGMWENTRPLDHWEFWHRLEATFTPGKCKVELNMDEHAPYTQRVGYNIAGLYDVVGDRMVQYGRMGRALEKLGYINLSQPLIDAAEYMASMSLDEWKLSKAEGKWRYDFVAEKMAHVTEAIAAEFYSTQYAMKDLKKDVAAIKAAMKTVKR